MILESFGPEETFELGQSFGQKAAAGGIYCLEGDLGTGKTVFTQGFARGLGISEPVNSPTFTIMQIYEEGRLPLYHFDVYRIADPEEMYEIGFDDYLEGEGVCLIEWPVRVACLLPENCTWIRIEKDPEKGFDYRRITVKEVEQ